MRLVGNLLSAAFANHFFYHKGDLSDYLARNSSLLLSYPTELGHIMNQVINGMVYLHECRVVHGELVRTNTVVY